MSWKRDKPLTEDELAAKRKEALAFYEEQGIHCSDLFTCDDCPSRFVCTLVFDAYNTNGDCLMEK